MRNQQTSIIRENNVFFPEIEPLSARSFQTQSCKSAMCITASNRGTVHRARSASHDCHGDNSLLAQPAFAQDKKERSFKRHAGDLLLKSEHGLCVYEEKRFRSSSFTFRPSSSSSETGPSEKRVRSSSFSLLTAFPPNQPALKNNVFMPSTLLPERTHRHNNDSEETLHTWTVIKPATLQPPQVTVSSDIESSQTGTEEKILEEESKALVNNAGQPKSAHGSTCILGTETRFRMQPFDQMPPKYTTDFVFGENMERRVMSPKRPTPSQTRVPLCRRESASSRLSYNRNWPYQKHRLHTSLIESAAAYTSRPRIKYELDQVKVITGEESERNVLQISCKLFVFNKESQVWTERGRGYLRLNDLADNDDGPFRSRIVMRNHGNLKLILNSKIFSGMKLERANRRSLRITATDLTDSSLKVFLVQASVKDAARLHAAIHHRLIAMSSFRAKQEQSMPIGEDESSSNSQLLNSDSEDEEDDEMKFCSSKMSDHLQLIRQRPVLYS
ncbi:ran-binding protein 3-like isoform X2 [Rana temporaria]|uniref:ran-binding protein 3-like isoform X2 n=1 Tax=Rana temporaria TaxID=8407 RepID=UPI001AAD15FB|nr:ran-binding protein 3-like isoform X2 [Rana temporaria]